MKIAEARQIAQDVIVGNGLANAIANGPEIVRRILPGRDFSDQDMVIIKTQIRVQCDRVLTMFGME